MSIGVIVSPPGMIRVVHHLPHNLIVGADQPEQVFALIEKSALLRSKVNLDSPELRRAGSSGLESGADHSVAFGRQWNQPQQTSTYSNDFGGHFALGESFRLQGAKFWGR
jgi:hypothetical protein